MLVIFISIKTLEILIEFLGNWVEILKPNRVEILMVI